MKIIYYTQCIMEIYQFYMLIVNHITYHFRRKKAKLNIYLFFLLIYN